MTDDTPKLHLETVLYRHVIVGPAVTVFPLTQITIRRYSLLLIMHGRDPEYGPAVLIHSQLSRAEKSLICRISAKSSLLDINAVTCRSESVLCTKSVSFSENS